MREIRLALLDMNNNAPNQGMRNIKEISEAYQRNADFPVKIEIFDVRAKNEVPNIIDFDIFISSGGPGNPHREGLEWEEKYAYFLDELWEYNQTNDDKKYLFLICHSFQLAAIHWDLGTVNKRKSYSFGVMPIHKTAEGETDYLFENLPEPFYAVDSRAYQLIQPKYDNFEKIGAKVAAIEKDRPNINLERAIMAIRFSDEIFATQFHPEADPLGMIENFKIDERKNALINEFGIEKYNETIDKLDDEDKIVLTRSQILPRFLKFATENILQEVYY